MIIFATFIPAGMSNVEDSIFLKKFLSLTFNLNSLDYCVNDQFIASNVTAKDWWC